MKTDILNEEVWLKLCGFLIESTIILIKELDWIALLLIFWRRRVWESIVYIGLLIKLLLTNKAILDTLKSSYWGKVIWIELLIGKILDVV